MSPAKNRSSTQDVNKNSMITAGVDHQLYIPEIRIKDTVGSRLHNTPPWYVMSQAGLCVYFAREKVTVWTLVDPGYANAY